jgi:hypothetical protein
MKEKTKAAEQASLLEEPEEYSPLVYNMWINATTINFTVENGGTLIFQTGKPKDEPRP